MADWERGGTYALSGAGVGAGIGTGILPGVGTAIGAGIGAIGGGLYGLLSEDEQVYNPNDPANQAQLQLAQLRRQAMLRAMGQGGPSIAEMQFRRGVDQTTGAAMGLARGVPGVSPGLALRRALNAQGTILADANQRAAMLRAAEQQAAMRDAAAMEQWQIGLEMDAAGANKRAEDQARARALGAGSAGFGQAFTSLEADRLREHELALASDRRVKKNVKRSPAEIRRFLDALDAASYDYKDPDKHGHGRQVGVMAQSVAKSRVGRPIVTTMDGETLAIDARKAVGPLLAAVKHLHDRTAALEERVVKVKLGARKAA